MVITSASRRVISRSFSSSPLSLSMIGRKTIKFPMDVGILSTPIPPAAASQFTQEISVSGPLGALRLPLPPFVSLSLPEPAPEDTKKTCQVTVLEPKNRRQRAMWGTARALIQNMVEGVSEGFVLPLRFEGVGYRVCWPSFCIDWHLTH